MALVVFLLLPWPLLVVMAILGAALVAQIVATVGVTAVDVCCMGLLLLQQQDLTQL
jgi:hypothetical protein